VLADRVALAMGCLMSVPLVCMYKLFGTESADMHQATIFCVFFLAMDEQLVLVLSLIRALLAVKVFVGCNSLAVGKVLVEGRFLECSLAVRALFFFIFTIASLLCLHMHPCMLDVFPHSGVISTTGLA